MRFNGAQAGELEVTQITLPSLEGLAGASSGRVDAIGCVLRFFGLGQITHAADLTNGGGYQPTETLTAFRESDGIAVDLFGRFFVTADEGDTLAAPCTSGLRGGRTVQRI